ncbi:GNAT family N-acetyltransferase [Kiloniella antarctica]|uniref:GNAT family N-acetyltransferase n=1 Tax=Kiloniella antarctica TaxID=1550907 RepID=A0ABW5BEX7_9PROT
MEQYFGTDIQIRLQRRADEYTKWMYSTAGACHPGRCLGCDDPDILGWDVIFEHLKRDGRFGFRMIPANTIDVVRGKLEKEGFGISFWNVFTGTATHILKATENLGSKALPEDLSFIPETELHNPELIKEVQIFLSDNGIPPVSGLMLSGQSVKSSTKVLRKSCGKIVAMAYGYFAHNDHSRHNKTGWGGLVAVDADYRGKGLGILVNASMLRECIRKLGAKGFYEQVSVKNKISQQMVERCGLTIDTTVLCGIATSTEAGFKLWGQ